MVQQIYLTNSPTNRISDALVNIPSDEELSRIRNEKKSNTSKGAHKKAYSYLSLVNGVVKRHHNWAECEKRVSGKNARFRKATSSEHEREIIEEWGYSLEDVQD